MVLDEPAAHLDALTAAEIRAAVARLAAGRTVILVTHDDRWLDLVDRTVVLRAGRVEPALAVA